MKEDTLVVTKATASYNVTEDTALTIDKQYSGNCTITINNKNVTRTVCFVKSFDNWTEGDKIRAVFTTKAINSQCGVVVDRGIYCQTENCVYPIVAPVAGTISYINEDTFDQDNFSYASVTLAIGDPEAMPVVNAFVNVNDEGSTYYLGVGDNNELYMSTKITKAPDKVNVFYWYYDMDGETWTPIYCEALTDPVHPKYVIAKGLTKADMTKSNNWSFFRKNGVDKLFTFSSFDPEGKTYVIDFVSSNNKKPNIPDWVDKEEVEE